MDITTEIQRLSDKVEQLETLLNFTAGATGVLLVFAVAITIEHLLSGRNK